MQRDYRIWALFSALSLIWILWTFYGLTAQLMSTSFVLKLVNFGLEATLLWQLYQLVSEVRRHRRLVMGTEVLVQRSSAAAYQYGSGAWLVVARRPLGFLFGSTHFAKDDLAIMYGFMLTLACLAWMWLNGVFLG